MVQIAVATTPSGHTTRGHLRAMQQDMIGYLESLATQGNFLRIPLGLGSAYFVNDAALVQDVLLKQVKKFHKPFTVKYTARGFFGENLFTSDGTLWQVLRSTLQPAFHLQRLHTYADLMLKDTQALMLEWQPGQTIDVPAAMMDLTLVSTTKAFFGQALSDRAAAQAIIRFIELFSERISSLPIPAWLPIPSNWAMKQQIAVIDRYLSPLIEERRRSGAEGNDVLSMLIQAQAADTSGLLTDHQVRNEVLNLFAAGYEVTAHTLAFTLYLISQNPAVEARLCSELDRVLGQQEITVADLEKLPYLEQVLKESMRLLPVTTVVSRQAIEPVALNGMTLPKNALVLIAPWTLHRRSDYFPDPLRFDPDRFERSRIDTIPKYAYLPFSVGPRSCIGSGFAMMQMRINLATILQRYRLTTLPDYQLEPFYRFNTRHKHGLRMVLQEREHSMK